MVLQEPNGDAEREPYLDSGNDAAGHCSNDFVNGGGWFGSFTVAIVLYLNYVFTVALYDSIIIYCGYDLQLVFCSL